MPDKIRPIADTDMLVVDDVTGAVKGIAPGGDQGKGATFGGGSGSGSVAVPSLFRETAYLTRAMLSGLSSGSSYSTVALGAGGQTWQIQTALECEFDAVQIGILNSDAAAVSGVTATALTWANAQADNSSAANYSGGTWTDITFAGAATGTLAANSSGSALTPAVTWSDIMQLPSVGRADAGRTLPGISVRIGYPGSAVCTVVPGPGTGGSGGAGWETDSDVLNGGRFWRVRGQAVQAASNATKAALTATTTATSQWPAVLIRYWPRGARTARTIVGVGDSITNAVGILAGGSGIALYKYGWLERLRTRYSTPTNPIEVINLGLGGASSTQIYTSAVAGLPLVPNGVVLAPNATPNDFGAPIVSGNISTSRTMKARLRALAAQLGLPIRVWTVLPSDPAIAALGKTWGSSDALRQAMNATDIATGVAIDLAAAVSGSPDASGQIPLIGTTDGLHPNDAGHDALAVAAAQSLGIA